MAGCHGVFGSYYCNRYHRHHDAGCFIQTKIKENRNTMVLFRSLWCRKNLSLLQGFLINLLRYSLVVVFDLQEKGLQHFLLLVLIELAFWRTSSWWMFLGSHNWSIWFTTFCHAMLYLSLTAANHFPSKMHSKILIQSRLLHRVLSKIGNGQLVICLHKQDAKVGSSAMILHEIEKELRKIKENEEPLIKQSKDMLAPYPLVESTIDDTSVLKNLLINSSRK